MPAELYSITQRCIAPFVSVFVIIFRFDTVLHASFARMNWISLAFQPRGFHQPAWVRTVRDGFQPRPPIRETYAGSHRVAPLSASLFSLLVNHSPDIPELGASLYRDELTPTSTVFGTSDSGDIPNLPSPWEASNHSHLRRSIVSGPVSNLPVYEPSPPLPHEIRFL